MCMLSEALLDAHFERCVTAISGQRLEPTKPQIKKKPQFYKLKLIKIVYICTKLNNALLVLAVLLPNAICSCIDVLIV